MEQEAVEQSMDHSEDAEPDDIDLDDEERADSAAAPDKDRFDYDGTYKRILSPPTGLAEFLQTFDPATAATLRLDTFIPRGAEVFDHLPAFYKRIPDIVAQVQTQSGQPRLIAVHLEIQSTRENSLGWRMLDYYVGLRRTLKMPVLPYALVLYRSQPTQGYRTYVERYDGRVINALTYYQISLPALDPVAWTAGGSPLARALSIAMQPPDAADLEGWRTRFSQAAVGVREEVRTGSWDEDALVALWTLIQHETFYQFEVETDWGVDWNEEDKEMVQQLNKRWIDDVKAEGIAIGEARGALEGLREALRLLVQARFGAIPDEIAQRIAAADRASLDALVVRASTVASVDAL